MSILIQLSRFFIVLINSSWTKIGRQVGSEYYFVNFSLQNSLRYQIPSFQTPLAFGGHPHQADPASAVLVLLPEAPLFLVYADSF